MPTNKEDLILTHLVELLELPDSAYEKAKDRYEDLGEWLGRDTSLVTNNDVHVFPQGSFRLGTAIKPLSDNEQYDLDLACNLRKGIAASTHTQEYLKTLIGYELEGYRNARHIQAPLEPKHRCWRLEYADGLRFHMDIVPSIPETSTQITAIFDSIRNFGMDKDLAEKVAAFAVGITDDRREDFKRISLDWLISNPEGYAKWFESRMQPTRSELIFDKAQVDDLPNYYKKKRPLQRVIQLLKRHRDKMFERNSDSKPISVIITTLAGYACTGSESIKQTMTEALHSLNAFANSGRTELLNPVNPVENFADRWTMPECAELRLKENFALWVRAATRDFHFLANNTDPDELVEMAKLRFSVTPSKDALSKVLGINTAASFPYVSTPRNVPQPDAKPWLNEE